MRYLALLLLIGCSPVSNAYAMEDMAPLDVTNDEIMADLRDTERESEDSMDTEPESEDAMDTEPESEDAMDIERGSEDAMDTDTDPDE
jgi:hypothetical protein